jgi:adenylosuccinate lyase
MLGGHAEIGENEKREDSRKENVTMSALGHQPLSPLDGRYREATQELAEYFSEAALNRARVRVEIEWLIALCSAGVANTSALEPEKIADLRSVVTHFGTRELESIAAYEATTKHDVKAVEYFVRDVLTQHGLESLAELVHFGCTSEDINNVSYALLTQEGLKEVWSPALALVRERLKHLAVSWRDEALLARTHGQPATPTTFGKELAVFVHRLDRVSQPLQAVSLPAKFSGATGTFSAHVSAEPHLDWEDISRSFIEGLGLEWNPLTTQIESHDGMSSLFQTVSHINRILHNLCTDMWTYISLGYLTQIPEPGATGSSTMPHKINPIRFENAEANLELSSALLDSLSASLVTSRLQRDLTDSTTQRNIGVALGHSLLALANLAKGLHEIDLNAETLQADLAANQEVLAEAIQTVIRAEIARGNSSIQDPYAVVKELTRGRRVNQATLAAFIDGLDISNQAKEHLGALTPQGYTGLASKLVDYLD